MCARVVKRRIMEARPPSKRQMETQIIKRMCRMLHEVAAKAQALEYCM